MSPKKGIINNPKGPIPKPENEILSQRIQINITKEMYDKIPKLKNNRVNQKWLREAIEEKLKNINTA